MSLKTPHISRRTQDNSRISGAGRGLNAHIMVAQTAVEMAQACFEAHMSANNELYRAFRQNLTEKQARLVFVKQVAPTLLEEARLALTDCLTQSDDEVSPRLKDEIAQALILDSDLRANRLKAAEHMPSSLLH